MATIHADEDGHILRVVRDTDRERFPHPPPETKATLDGVPEDAALDDLMREQDWYRVSGGKLVRAKQRRHAPKNRDHVQPDEA